MRTFIVDCWQCGGFGTTGYFLNRNLHVSVECWVCHGHGYKRLRRYKR